MAAVPYGSKVTNRAFTVVSAFMVTVQRPTPEQPPPLQPRKRPTPAEAVSVTTVPSS
jgi:hypothetical protein